MGACIGNGLASLSCLGASLRPGLEPLRWNVFWFWIWSNSSSRICLGGRLSYLRGSGMSILGWWSEGGLGASSPLWCWRKIWMGEARLGKTFLLSRNRAVFAVARIRSSSPWTGRAIWWGFCWFSIVGYRVCMLQIRPRGSGILFSRCRAPPWGFFVFGNRFRICCWLLILLEWPGRFGGPGSGPDLTARLWAGALQIRRGCRNWIFRTAANGAVARQSRCFFQ